MRSLTSVARRLPVVYYTQRAKRVFEPDDTPTHRVADTMRPAFRRAVLAGVTATQRQLAQLPLVRLLRNFQAPDHAINWTMISNGLLDALRSVVRETVERSARAQHIPGVTIKQDEPRGALAFSFDITNPEAVRWIDQHAAEVVLGLTEKSRDAIRILVARSFREGIPPARLARMIREHIGLTVPQSTALFNYGGQLDRAVNEGRLTATRATALGERYQRRLLAFRADGIARTETMTASERGAQELFRQARDEGLLRDDRTRRQWLVTRDERLCPICAPIPGMSPTVPMDTSFQTPIGPLEGPPAHPRCRCTTRLVFVRPDGTFPEPLPAQAFAGKPGPPRRRLRPRIPR